MSIMSEITVSKIELNKTLLAGPWVGELGTELFCWQGYLRSIAHRYNKVIVMGKTGHEILYEDFCSKYIEFNPDKDGSQAVEIEQRSCYNKILNVVKNIEHDEWLKPFVMGYSGKKNHVLAPEFTGQRFLKLKSDSLNKKYDIIIHPRNKNSDTYRNWNKNKWKALINLVGKEYHVALIGGDESLTFKNVDEYKNHSLRDVVSLMNRTKLVVSPISGPIHLAALCDTRHLTWGAPIEINKCDSHWNPFRTFCYYKIIQEYDPTLDEVYEYVIEAMKML